MTSPFENFKKSLNASKSAQAAYTIFEADLRVRAATALSGKIEAAYNRISLFAEKHNILFVTVSNEGNVLHQSQSVMDALMFNGFTDAAMRIALVIVLARQSLAFTGTSKAQVSASCSRHLTLTCGTSSR